MPEPFLNPEPCTWLFITCRVYTWMIAFTYDDLSLRAASLLFIKQTILSIFLWNFDAHDLSTAWIHMTKIDHF